MDSFRKRYKKRVFSSLALSTLAFVIGLLFLTIGFSVFQASVEISNITAVIRVQKDIRVTGVYAINATNGASSNYEEYDVNRITSSLHLPNANSTMTYHIEVTNIGNTEQGIYAINEIYKKINSNIDSNLEIKSKTVNLKEALCDDSNSTECKLGSVTTFDITIGYKNNGYNGTDLTHLIELEFDFRRVFNITYSGFSGNTSGLPSQMIDGDTKTITFNATSGIPTNVVVTGASGSYSSPTLTLSNVTIQNLVDTIVVTKAYSITYSGFSGNTSGLPQIITASGGTITFDSTSGIPTNVSISGGATGNYVSPTLTINPGVTGDITITVSNSGGGDQPLVEDDTTTTYDPNNVPPNSNIIYTAVDGAPQVTTDENGNITSFEFTDASENNPVTITTDNAISTGFMPFNGGSNWELDMTFSYDSEANSSTSNSKTAVVLACSDWSSGSMTSGFTFRFYNFKNVAGTTSTYRFNGMLKYRPQLQVENNGTVDTLYGLYTTGSSGVFMTSPMTYTVHIVKNGNNITFELSNGSQLNYHPTSNKNTGYSTADANTKKTVTWQDNGSSSNVDITIGGYLSSAGVIAQKSNITVYNFSVRRTN